MRTREAREIGGLEGPGSGRSSGLLPRALFFSAKSEKNGVRRCPGPQKPIRSDPLGTLGPELGGGALSFPRLLRFSENPPGIFTVPEAPPGNFRRFRRPPNTAGSAAPVSGRRGGREIGKSGVSAKGREEKITEDEERRRQRDEERRRMADGERKKTEEKTITYDRC